MEKAHQENKLRENLLNSDITIFQEISIADWTVAQQARLYTIINARYQPRLPFIATCTEDEDLLEERIGSPNFYRLSDNGSIIDLGD